MGIAYSVPLDKPPAFLSSVSMVADDHRAIIKGLRNAERPSPAFYAPARDLFLQDLRGKVTYDFAIRQARYLQDKTEKKCAVSILTASAKFLRSQPPARISQIDGLYVQLPNCVKLDVSPIWLKVSNRESLLVLHFWETPLSQRQLSAAAAILRRAVSQCNPIYFDHEIDFISVSIREHSNERHFQCLGCKKLKPLESNELDKFLKMFSDAWDEYTTQGRREYRARRNPDLFSKRP